MQWKGLFFLLCLSGLLFGEKTSKKRTVSFLAFLQNDYVHLRNLVRSLQQLKIDEKQIILIETVPDYFRGDNIETSELFKHCHHLPYNKSCGGLAEIYDKIKAENDRTEVNLKRMEELAARNLLGGKSDAGLQPAVKEETPKEYSERILKNG